jgi:hypothetical protein
MRRRIPLVLGAVVVVLLAGACGPDRGDGTSVASLGNGRGGSTAGQDRGGDNAEKDPEEAALAFARCMREHGVDMPDPQVDEGGRMRFEARGAGPGAGEEDFAKAHEACQDLLGEAGPQNLSPEDRKAMQDAMVAYARCMREHGIDMPDPDPETGGIVVHGGKEASSSAADPRSPEFKAAERECRKHTEATDRKLGVQEAEGR